MPLPFSSLWLSAEHDQSQMASARSFGGGRLKWIERDNYDDYEGIGIPQLSTNSANQDSRREVYGGKEPTDRPSSSSSAANATSSVRGGLPGRDRGVNPLPDGDTQEDEDDEGNSNDGFCDIHVTEENGSGRRRSRQGRRRHHHNSNWSDTSMMSAGGSSMVSGGSTTETESISLSREFRAVLTAARTTNNNTHHQALEALLQDNSSNSNQRRNGSPLLPGIGEDEPLSTSSSATGTGHGHGRGPTGEYDSNHAHGHMAIVPTSSPHQHDNHNASGAADALALVPTNDDSTGFGSDREAPNNSSSECERSIQGDGSNTRTPWKDANTNIERSPTRIILEKVKKDRTEAKAIAWQDAEIAKVENRFKRDDSVITAWEDEQRVKASIKMKSVERKLEEKRAKAYEKMQNEIAKAHRKAENSRAAAEARKSAAKAKISKTFEKIRSIGKLPRKFLFF